MSPGARTIPAAMVFPTAAATPNQTPKTLRRRPREIRLAPGADCDTGISDSSGKQDSQGKFGNVVMIMVERGNAKRELADRGMTAVGVRLDHAMTQIEPGSLRYVPAQTRGLRSR